MSTHLTAQQERLVAKGARWFRVDPRTACVHCGQPTGWRCADQWHTVCIVCRTKHQDEAQ